MSLAGLDADIAELARVRVAIEQARAHQDVPLLSRLTEQRDQLRALIGVAAASEPRLETARLRHELAGLRELVAAPPPNLGLSVASCGGGSAAGTFPHGHYNRAVNNDESSGYRSRNSALERIQWIEARLAELDGFMASD